MSLCEFASGHGARSTLFWQARANRLNSDRKRGECEAQVGEVSEELRTLKTEQLLAKFRALQVRSPAEQCEEKAPVLVFQISPRERLQTLPKEKCDLGCMKLQECHPECLQNSLLQNVRFD